MLGVSFLDSTQAQIDQLKYDHPFCGSCMEHGLNYAPAHLPPANTRSSPCEPSSKHLSPTAS